MCFRLLNTIAQVLSTFRESRFAVVHALNLSISWLHDWIRVEKSEFLNNKVVSSANNTVKKLFERLCKSFRYKIKRVGERIAPWGRPILQGSLEDWELLIFVNWYRFER